MRILLISYDFPPSPNAHAHRWFGVIQEWLRRGHQVDVVSSLEATDTRVKPLADKGFSLLRTGNRQINRFRGVDRTPLGNAVPANQTGIWHALRRQLRRLYGAVYWPDGLWHWYPYAAAAARTLSAQRYDLVVTYSPTFVTHLIGMRLLRKGRTAAWLADYGDPFSVSPRMPANNARLYRALNLAVERKVLRRATASSYTNETTQALYREHFPEGVQIIVPHAVSLAEFERLDVPQSESAARPLVLTYVGALHRTIREPGPTIDNLLAALAKRPDFFTVRFIGILNGVTLPRHDAIRVDAAVPRELALPIMAQAEILIHIENTGVPMSPSKLVDYIACGKPILNFHSGEISPLLASWPYALNLHVDDDNSQTILRFLDASRNKRAPRDEIARQLAAHDVGAIAQKILELAKDPSAGGVR